MNFTSQTHGKWILAGEHTVLRGGEALVFPVRSRKMVLNYTAGNEILDIECQGESCDVLKPFFGALLNKALEVVNRSADELSGRVLIENQIPVGAGMGASAALCVNIANWFVHLDWLDSNSIFSFAKQLETIPHGESSGVDIATIMENKGITFRRNGEWLPIQVNWKPNWFLFHSGEQGITAKCVKQVQQLIEENPDLGKEIDEQMKESVEEAKTALLGDADHSFSNLVSSIEKAHQCFEKWNLVDEKMNEKIRLLKNSGAIACKPVGSGGGGYLLGIWRQGDTPSNEIIEQLIPCN